jgi:hypothetical protein
MLSSARLILLALLAATFSLAADAVEWPPSQAVQQRVDQAVGILDRLEALAPEAVDEITDLAVALEFDDQAAIRHVAEQIAYVPYLGVLRGPDGARITRGGNAWDQAVLLASLLKTMGVDAQVAVGPLSNQDAARLLAQVFRPAASPGFVLDVDALAAIMADFDPALAQQFREQSQAGAAGGGDPLQGRSLAMAEQLLVLLSQAGVELSESQSAAPLIEAIAADYAWVRWRLGPGSDWADVHPAFATDSPPTPTAQRYLDAEVPAEHQHRVAFQLFIERGRPDGRGQIELIPVMDRWERPTANLFKNQVSLGMGPMRIQEGADTAMLVPILNGRLAPGAKAVTELGLTADPDAAGSAAGELFANLSSSLGTVAGAIDGLADGSSGSIPRLIGVVLEVSISAPGQENTIRRRVVDLRAAADDAFPNQAAFATVFDIDVGTGDPGQIYRQLIAYNRAFIRATPALMALARGALSPQDANRVAAYRDLGPARWLDFDLHADSLALPASETVAIFRPGALIASRRSLLDPQQGVLSVIDILANPAVVLERTAAGDITIAPRKVLAQGVRETLIESELAGASPGWSARPPARVIASVESLQRHVQSAGWSSAAVERAEADLAAGFVLAAVDGPGPWWWRVNPVSGQTLGMGTQGGSEVLEYLVMIGGAAASTYLFYASVESCDKKYADNRDMADCCIVGNLAATYTTTAVTAGAGVLFSGALAAATGAIESALLVSLKEVGFGVSLEVIGNLSSEVATKFSVGAACRAYLDRN